MELKVSICCPTFNQEKFIRKALDGILMQVVDFKYEIIVHDDASTDGTKEILFSYQKEYPDIFKLIIQTDNQYSKGIRILPTYLLPKVKGQYIAICDGDDYWIDVHKLQKQVDFLDTHEEYIATHSDANVFLQKNQSLIKNINKVKKRRIRSGDIFNDKLIGEYRVFTSSLLYRKTKGLNSVFRNYGEGPGDLILILELSRLGLVKYFNQSFITYRVSSSGITHVYDKLDSLRFQLNSLQIRLKAAHHFGVDDDSIELLRWKSIITHLHLAYLENDKSSMKELNERISLSKLSISFKDKLKIKVVLGQGLESLLLRSVIILYSVLESCALLHGKIKKRLCD